MNVSDFDYDLPARFIAQEPVEPRDSSRLMVLDRDQQTVNHRHFRDIAELLNPGDILVVNDTRVIPARLFAHKRDTGGQLEILLLKQLDGVTWRALIGGKRARPDTRITMDGSDIEGTVTEAHDGAERTITFSSPIDALVHAAGQMPLPPYIHHTLSDRERYQTVYSREEGSAAAPTAGLHFTPDLLLALRERGVRLAYCTLHVGLDTFQPVRVDMVEEHHIHSERASLNADNAHIINQAKLAGGRIIAVGTTSARTLETAAILSAGGDPSNPSAMGDICAWRPVIAFEQDTRLFIYPGYTWRAVDGMITNFHLPKSSLLMMISAFAGREFVLRAYETAKKANYRFYSFGDAMFIT